MTSRLAHRRQVVRNRRHHTPKPQLAGSALDRSRARPHASPLLLMAEAAAYLRYSGDRAAEKALRFLRSHQVPLLRRGRTYLVRPDAIDAALSGAPSPLDVAAEAVARADRSRPKLAAAGR